jgi:fusion protein PurCD
MQTVRRFSTPQLELLHRGKVRDSFRADPQHRLLMVTDRLSAFDEVLETAIPFKGAVLNGLSAFWFEQTRHIVPNHFERLVDPCVSLVKECQAIPIEVVVRGYLTGSMWRAYENGRRVFCGVHVPDGLTKNQAFPAPLLTPTTKSEHDEEASPAELVASGRVSEAHWKIVEKAALALFAHGTELLASRGLILCDTKYEFGLLDGEVILIDEIHTPDSSRIWPADAWAADPLHVESLDKEFVRIWLMAAARQGIRPRVLPPEIAAETTRRYLELYTRVTGEPLPIASSDEDPRDRIVRNLTRGGFVRDAWVAVIMGSSSDLEHARRIRDELLPYDVAVDMRVVSAHKNGECIERLAADYEDSLEHGVVIAVAGLSNGLGGALAANLNVPVLSCPPYRDLTDLQINLPSSLFLPSDVPAGTVLRPSNAAHLALRCLNLRRLRDRFSEEKVSMKASLASQDFQVRGQERRP